MFFDHRAVEDHQTSIQDSRRVIVFYHIFLTVFGEILKKSCRTIEFMHVRYLSLTENCHIMH